MKLRPRPTVVRIVILPATLTLLDHRSWYLPGIAQWFAEHPPGDTRV
jgi:hypothetical protein